MRKDEFIVNYFYKNYYDDGEKLCKMPIIAAMINHATEDEIPSLIDKVAIMNGIKKSYPPQEIVVNA